MKLRFRTFVTASKFTLFLHENKTIKYFFFRFRILLVLGRYVFFVHLSTKTIFKKIIQISELSKKKRKKC